MTPLPRPPYRWPPTSGNGTKTRQERLKSVVRFARRRLARSLPNAVTPRRLEKTLSDFGDTGCLMDEMHEKSDAQLLRGYAQHGDEAAFREIVTRHTDLVYSVAVRCVNSPDLACDIAQSVFTDLSSKARPLAEKLAEDAAR